MLCHRPRDWSQPLCLRARVRVCVFVFVGVGCGRVGAWVVASMQQQAVGSIWDSFRSTHIPVAPLQINVADVGCSFFDL